MVQPCGLRSLCSGPGHQGLLLWPWSRPELLNLRLGTFQLPWTFSNHQAKAWKVRCGVQEGRKPTRKEELGSPGTHFAPELETADLTMKPFWGALAITCEKQGK